MEKKNFHQKRNRASFLIFTIQSLGISTAAARFKIEISESFFSKHYSFHFFNVNTDFEVIFF